MSEASGKQEGDLPFKLITDIQPGEYVHRWGDWLQVRNIDTTNHNNIKLTVFDTNPSDGGEAKEITWDGYKRTSELISVGEFPPQKK